MSVILTYVAVAKGQIKRSSLEVLSRSRELAEQRGLSLAALLAHPGAAEFAAGLGAFGVDTAYVVEHPVFERHTNTPLIDAVQRVVNIAKPRLVTFASTESVKDVLGALAVRLGAAAIPDVSAFSLTDDGVEAVRPVMAAKKLAGVHSTADCVLVSVRSGSYTATPSQDGAESAAQVVAVDFPFDASSTPSTLREVIETGAGTVDLSEASVVVAAGRGVKDEQGRALVEELASVMGAAIGATRAVVENGMYPATAQIGQTGKVVSPDLYFAAGISGAIQHVAGMANSRVIVAINKDADAPIFEYATYGLVGDLYKVLPPLIEGLRNSKNSS